MLDRLELKQTTRELILRCNKILNETEEWILEGSIVSPLADLGLLEKQAAKETPREREAQIRVTALWRKFIRFDPWPAPRL